MSFLIAAAGTGGHVYPGLAVGEALVDAGTDRSDIRYVGGDRLESKVYPDAGFPFLQLDLRGLKRSLAPSNLSLPLVVLRARNRIKEEISTHDVRCVLGTGNYVTIPTAMAARNAGVPLMVAEQNAGDGLANRIAGRWATRAFGAFPRTDGLEKAEWAGNPVRSSIANYNRSALRPRALEEYGLRDELPVLGVFGGSLGALTINEAISKMLAEWDGPPIQILHLVGPAHSEDMDQRLTPEGVSWRRKPYEQNMELFFAACDLIVARAGGSVAEIIATATPSILIPGDFGASGHQGANAVFLEEAGAATILLQEDIDQLGVRVKHLLGDPDRLISMRNAGRSIAKPDAAKTIALAMIEAAA